MPRTEVLVVGGGSTGTGVARDLALRGLDVTLVERGNLTSGTTGRMHGLLHSGARYAVSEPSSARQCIRENRILREIAAHCVDPTGGLFVKRPEDSGDYFDRKLEACRACSIPATVLSGEGARDAEPALAPDVDRAIRVPDAAIDPFRLTVANAADAEAHGARIETGAEVTDLLVEAGEVLGAELRYGSGPGGRSHGTPGTTERIEAHHVVNATGAWVGQVAALAGVDVTLRPSRGAMVVTDVRQVDTVINRCRPRGGADIIVPRESTAVLGTTDEPVSDPDDFPEEEWEVDLLVDELSKLVPAVAEARTVSSFWGVRPLYQPPDSEGGETADVAREFYVLDHAGRDGLRGLTSVVGGKLTTYRLMAERASDLVCERLDASGSCRTDERPLPGNEDPAVLRELVEEFGVRAPVDRR